MTLQTLLYLQSGCGNPDSWCCHHLFLACKVFIAPKYPILRYPTDSDGTFKPLTVPLQGLMTDKSNIAVFSDQCTITLVWERTTEDGYIIGL
jgi:hypothetical protein